MVTKLFIKLELVVSAVLVFIKHMLDYNNHPKPVYTKSNGGLRVHLGAGGINLQGWVNVDARNLEHIHLTTNNFLLREFSDNSISEIYLCHVLEHFSFCEVETVLGCLHKKLKAGGTIRISVPSFDAIVEVYLNNSSNLESIKLALMGGQEYEYNYHKSVFNSNSLKALLTKNGYCDALVWDTVDDFGADLGDWSNKFFKTPKGKVPISLNLKARKID